MSELARLGQLFKKKFPEARKLSDEQAGMEAKRRYPGKYDNVKGTELVRQPLPDRKPDRTPNNPVGIYSDHSPMRLSFERAEAVRALYDPNIGFFKTIFANWRITRQTSLLQTETEKITALLAQGAVLEQSALDSGKRRTEYERFVAENEYALYLLHEASIKGYTLENWQIAKLQELSSHLYKSEQEHNSELWTNEQNTTTENQMRLEEAQKNNRIDEYKTKAEIDLQNTLIAKQEAVKMALLSKQLSEIQKVTLLQQKIDEMNLEIDDIDSDYSLSERARKQMIDDRDEIITEWRETRRAINRRLRETHTGGTNLIGTNEDTNLR